MQILRSSRSTLIVATLAGVAPISGGTSIAQAGGDPWGGDVGTIPPTIYAPLTKFGSSAPALTLDQNGHNLWITAYSFPPMSAQPIVCTAGAGQGDACNTAATPAYGRVYGTVWAGTIGGVLKCRCAL